LLKSNHFPVIKLLDFFILVVFILSTLFLVSKILTPPSARLYHGLFTIANFIYSGVGATRIDSNYKYLWYFFSSQIAFSISFVLASNQVRGTIRNNYSTLSDEFSKRLSKKLLLGLYVGFLATKLFALVYPFDRLDLIISPPSVNLLGKEYEISKTLNKDLFSALASVAGTLLEPVVFLIIFVFRKRPTLAISLFVIPSYLSFVADGYIGRGDIGIIIIIIWSLIYTERNLPRWILIASIGVLLFTFLVFSNYYSAYRIGGAVNSSSILDSAVQVLDQETSFPEEAGRIIIESGIRYPFDKYCAWIVTLPIPKALVPALDIPHINYTISAIINGKLTEDSGFFVSLPGLVAESVFIYGDYFYWLHFIFIGVISALVISVYSVLPVATYLVRYLFMILSYNLCRAGISAVLPFVSNSILLVNLLVIYCLVHSHRVRR
jgi:hypothetical protein